METMESVVEYTLAMERLKNEFDRAVSLTLDLSRFKEQTKNLSNVSNAEKNLLSIGFESIVTGIPQLEKNKLSLEDLDSYVKQASRYAKNIKDAFVKVSNMFISHEKQINKLLDYLDKSDEFVFSNGSNLQLDEKHFLAMVRNNQVTSISDNIDHLLEFIGVYEKEYLSSLAYIFEFLKRNFFELVDEEQSISVVNTFNKLVLDYKKKLIDFNQYPMPGNGFIEVSKPFKVFKNQITHKDTKIEIEDTSTIDIKTSFDHAQKTNKLHKFTSVAALSRQDCHKLLNQILHLYTVIKVKFKEDFNSELHWSKILEDLVHKTESMKTDENKEHLSQVNKLLHYGYTHLSSALSANIQIEKIAELLASGAIALVNESIHAGTE